MSRTLLDSIYNRQLFCTMRATCKEPLCCSYMARCTKLRKPTVKLALDLPADVVQCRLHATVGKMIYFHAWLSSRSCLHLEH